MENRSLLPICSLFNSSLKLSLTVKAKEQVCLLQSQIWEPTQLGVLALKNFLTQTLTLFFYSFKGKLVFGGALAITYLFPLSLSVANAFKLLNEEPGGSEKILLWLKSKCRNLARRSTTVGTSVNSFQDKSMLSEFVLSGDPLYVTKSDLTAKRPTQLGVLALKTFLTQTLTLFFYSFKGKLVFGGALAITYLFPLSLSVANAFKLLNEEPGGSEKILLWLKSKCRNLARRSTTVGTSVNSFQDKSMLSSSL